MHLINWFPNVIHKLIKCSYLLMTSVTLSANRGSAHVKFIGGIMNSTPIKLTVDDIASVRIKLQIKKNSQKKGHSLILLKI